MYSEYKCYSPSLRDHSVCADVTFNESLPFFSCTPAAVDIPQYVFLVINPSPAIPLVFPSLRTFTSSVSSVYVSNIAQEALSLSEWQTTMESEMSVLHNNGTWELISLPLGKSTVGYHLVFIVKYNRMVLLNGMRHALWPKATPRHMGLIMLRLSPIAKIGFVRVFISFAANLGWPVAIVSVR